MVTRAAVVDAASVSTPFDVAGARGAVARTQGKVRLMSPGGPTPLERAPRLSEALGIDLYIKRDDCTGLASGGNKTRKLEYLLAQALEMYPDGDCVVMTQGATQSNHARQTAAAAAKLGMKCHILLENRTGRSDENYTRNGNVLLDDLFGATRESRPSGMNMNEELERVADEWRARGEKVFTIVGGGSCPTGALGYVEAALEFTEQAALEGVDFDYFVHATGSAGTQAGLAVGFGLIQSPVKLLGFGVRMPKDIQETNVFNLATRTAAGLGLDPASVSPETTSSPTRATSVKATASQLRAPSTPFACSPRTKAYCSIQCTAAKAPQASLTTPSAACSPKAPKYAFSTLAAPSAYTAISTPSSTTTPPPHRKPPTTNHHHINPCNTFNSSFSSHVSRQYARLPSPPSSHSTALRARREVPLGLPAGADCQTWHSRAIARATPHPRARTHAPNRTKDMANNSSDRAAPREMPKPRRVARESDANVVVDATASANARDDATTPSTPTLTHLGFVNDATTSGVKYVSEHALTSKVMGAYAGARDATALKVREYSLRR